jgi:hypothetical protein
MVTSRPPPPALPDPTAPSPPSTSDNPVLQHAVQPDPEPAQQSEPLTLKVSLRNPHADTIGLTSLEVTLPLGATDTALCVDTQSITVDLGGDKQDWGYTPISAPGQVTYQLTNSDNAIVPGETVHLTLANIAVNSQPGTATITITEHLTGHPGQPQGYSIPKIPAGLQFGNLRPRQILTTPSTPAELTWTADHLPTGTTVYLDWATDAGPHHLDVTERHNHSTTLVRDTAFTLTATIPPTPPKPPSLLAGRPIVARCTTVVTVAKPHLTAHDATVRRRARMLASAQIQDHPMVCGSAVSATADTDGLLSLYLLSTTSSTMPTVAVDLTHEKTSTHTTTITPRPDQLATRPVLVLPVPCGSCVNVTDCSDANPGDYTIRMYWRSLGTSPLHLAPLQLA